MQISGLSFRSLFRNYDIINTAWQTFWSKMRGAEELEMSAGRGELKTHAVSGSGVSLHNELHNSLHVSKWWRLWKDWVPRGDGVVRSVPSTFPEWVLRRLYLLIGNLCLPWLEPLLWTWTTHSNFSKSLLAPTARTRCILWTRCCVSPLWRKVGQIWVFVEGVGATLPFRASQRWAPPAQMTPEEGGGILAPRGPLFPLLSKRATVSMAQGVLPQTEHCVD